MKRYLPTTYVNIKTGECYCKQDLENKIFKRYGTEKAEKKDEFTGYTYVYTTCRIGNIQTAPKQGTLF